MMVSQLVPVEHICIGWPTSKIPPIKNKWELIRSTVIFLSEMAGISPEMCENAIHLVIEREKSMTTAIGHGIAIPHASIANLQKPVGACVIFDEGIDFEAIDHESVQIVILALLPEKEYKKHIQTLSNIVDLTSSPGLKEKLLKMNTSNEVWKEISSLEKSLKKSETQDKSR